MDNPERDLPTIDSSNIELMGPGSEAAQSVTLQPAQQLEQPLQPGTIQPMTGQSDEARADSNSAKPKRAALILSSIAFALLSIAFLIIGPGVLITAMSLGGLSWIVSFYYMDLVIDTSIVSLLSTVLYVVAGVIALRKTPKYLINMLIMLAGNVVGLAAMWISGYGIVRLSTVVMTIVMSACVILPCVGLIVLRRFRKRNAPQPKSTSSLVRIFAIVALVVLVAESGVGVFYWFQLWQQYRPLIEASQQYQKEQEERFAEAVGDKDLSSQLGSMSFALCQGGFDIVHQIQGNDEDAIIQCGSTGDIYELHGAYGEEDDYIVASAVYYGTTKDEILAQYFPGQRYIYKNLRNSSYSEEVFLLLQANSVEEVIEKYSEPLFEYIKERNATYHTNIDFEILYNEDLSGVTTTKDYVLLAGIHDVVASDWLPYGNGFSGPHGENYIFHDTDDELIVLGDLGMNPGSYSEQTRNALKFHPHLSFSVTDGDQITLEELRAVMQESRFCQNADLDWESC